jgi:hypothetical protein
MRKLSGIEHLTDLDVDGKNYTKIYPKLIRFMSMDDRLCGIVFRVPGYTSRGPGFHSRLHPIF